MHTRFGHPGLVTVVALLPAFLLVCTPLCELAAVGDGAQHRESAAASTRRPAHMDCGPGPSSDHEAPTRPCQHPSADGGKSKSLVARYASVDGPATTTRVEHRLVAHAPLDRLLTASALRLRYLLLPSPLAVALRI